MKARERSSGGSAPARCRRGLVGEAGARPALSRNCDAVRSPSGGEVRSPNPPRPTPFARKGKDVGMMRVPRAILRSMDNECISSQRSSSLPRFVRLFLALSLAASVATLSEPGSMAQEATLGALSEATAMSPVEAASTWLREQQDTSGGFSGLSDEPDPGTTTDAVMALYAAQQSDPAATASLDAALAYLEQEENGAVYAKTGPGQAAKLALAAVTGGRDPRQFAGLDLVAGMSAPPAIPAPGGISGIYGDDLYDHALVLIALSAANEAVPDAALHS